MALVCSPPASEPASGSVKANAGIISPEAIPGKNFLRILAGPASTIGWLANPWVAIVALARLCPLANS